MFETIISQFPEHKRREIREALRVSEKQHSLRSPVARERGPQRPHGATPRRRAREEHHSAGRERGDQLHQPAGGRAPRARAAGRQRGGGVPRLQPGTGASR